MLNTFCENFWKRIIKEGKNPVANYFKFKFFSSLDWLSNRTHSPSLWRVQIPQATIYILVFNMVFIFSKDKTMQKNRYFSKPKPLRLNYGNAGFITDHEGRLELIHLFFLKKRLKKFILKQDLRIAHMREKI